MTCFNEDLGLRTNYKTLRSTLEVFRTFSSVQPYRHNTLLIYINIGTNILNNISNNL